MRECRVVLAVLCAVVSSGCARRFQPDAFRRGTTVAVAGVYTMPSVDYVRTYMTTGFNGHMDTRSDSVEIGKASAVFPETKRVALRAIAASRRFRLVPEDKVLGTGAYASVPASQPDIFTRALVPARGYKPLFSARELGEAARRLRVDGAMTVNLQHSCVPADGGVAARVFVGLAIVDPHGEYMWADWMLSDSKRVIPEGQTLTMEALRPLLIAAAEDSTRQLLQRLDERLAAR